MDIGTMDMADSVTLLTLPTTILERIFSMLGERDIANASSACQQFSRIGRSEPLWLSLCRGVWGAHTTIPRWLASEPLGCFKLSQYRELAPISYRAVYRLLKVLAQTIGLWQKPHNLQGTNTVLCKFHWTANSIQATAYHEDSMHTGARQRDWLSLDSHGMAMPASVSARSQIKLLMRDYSSAKEAMFSREAAAAAAVACSGTRSPGSDGSSILGTSPEGSFDLEMLRFMQGNVAGSRKGRRRSSGSSPQGGKVEADTSMLVHVRLPIATRAHPLAGLFKGVYGAYGVQTLAVEYTFVGPAARITATKVAGDAMHVSPGEQSWTAAAAPLPKPWPTREAAAIAMRWNLARGDDHLLSSQSDPHLRDEDKQVVACFKGRGLVMGGLNQTSREVDGRLWLYDNGDLGFVWLDDIQFLVDFQRVDQSYQ